MRRTRALIPLAALSVFLCSAGCREVKPEIVPSAGDRYAVYAVDDCPADITVPGCAAAPYAPAVEFAQVERYPGVNLNALESDNAREICARLLNAGLPYPAIAGILANIERESNYNPEAVNSIGAVGLCQWLGVRARSLYAREGCWSVKTQVEFLLDELELTDNACDMSGSAYECGYIFARDFERTGIAATYRDRGALAEDIYKEVFVG